MPIEWIDDPEEFARITGGYRGSWIIEMPPAGRPKPSKKSQEVFLSPHCLELCTGSRPGVPRCDPCDKEWG
jgi:hypothetical protein